MKIVYVTTDTYGFECDYYSKALVAACRATPGMKWDGDLRMWKGRPDACASTLEKLTAGGLTIDAFELPAPTDWTAVKGARGKGLRKYQAKGVTFLAENAKHGVLLADVMGAGKSAQAVHAAAQLGGHVLIVCPSFVRGVWAGERGELVKWWPEGIPVHVQLEGVKGQGPIPDVKAVICHYDILYAWVDALKAWGVDTLILDECHFISHADTRRSKAVKDIAEIAKNRIGLSGTPLTNRPADLWNVVDTLSPGRFGSFFGYAATHCNAHQVVVGAGPNQKTVWDFGGRSNLDELRRRLPYFMLRRTHDDIALELPPKTRQMVEVSVPPQYRFDITEDMLIRKSGQAVRRCLDYAADGKLKEVVGLIRQHAEDGAKVVCFTYRRAVAEAITNALRVDGAAASYIHGEVPQSDRDKIIEQAKSAEGGFVLCASIDVASVGIDLSFANVGVFAELTWEPHELLQAEARLHRFGQTKPVLIQYVIAQGTGEELTRDAVLSKLDTWADVGVGEAGGDELKKDLAPPTGADALSLLYQRLKQSAN